MVESVELRAPAISGHGGGLSDIPGSLSFLEVLALHRDALGFFERRFAEHGHLFKTRLVIPVVVAVGEEANRTILLTRRRAFSFGQGYARTAVGRVFARSIMLQDGEEHARTRGMLTPAVGRLAIRENVADVQRVWQRTAEILSDGQPRDCYEVGQRTTFRVAANVLTGIRLGDETERLRPHFENLIRGVMVMAPVRIPFGHLDRGLKARDHLIEMLRPQVIAAREREPAGLLGQLAHQQDEHGEPMDADEVIEHLLLLFWAGYDTTASAASWILHVLARRPEWQERLRDELAREVGDDVTSIEGHRNLTQLPWFLHEVERLYPSIMIFPRVALEDIPMGPYTVPKGTATFYSPYLSHRDPTVFEDPLTFDPDRWDPARGEERPHPRVLVGFGAGPRICLGKAFALMQLRVMIHTLLSRYDIRVDPSRTHRVQGIPVHHPVDSMVRFEAR